MTAISQKSNKAAILFQLIGDYLPQSVLERLDTKDIQKLIDKLARLSRTTVSEENHVLKDFQNALNFSPRKTQNDLNQKITGEIVKILRDNIENKSNISALKKKKQEEINLIIKDESPKMIALVMCNADPGEVSKVLEELPENLRGQILNEIDKIDFHSEQIADELERFLSFKYELINSDSTVSKIKNRGGRKAADILTRLNPHLSSKILSKIKENNPQFAENINEHFYTFEDLLTVNRSSLSKFISKFHPIVVACALKGVETEKKEQIIETLEPWLAKSIELEIDSMGPISLAEIEEAQKGILEELQNSVDNGEIKLWKVEL